MRAGTFYNRRSGICFNSRALFAIAAVVVAVATGAVIGPGASTTRSSHTTGTEQVSQTSAPATLTSHSSFAEEVYSSHLSLVQLRAQPRVRVTDSVASVLDVENVTLALTQEAAAASDDEKRHTCTCGVDCGRFRVRDRGTPLACWQPAAAWCKLAAHSPSRVLAQELPQKCMIDKDVEGAAAVLLEMHGSSPEALDGNARYCYEVGHCSGQRPLPTNATLDDIEARCDRKYADPKGGAALWRRITVGEVVSGLPSHGFGLLACALRHYYLCDAALCHREFCSPENAAKYGHVADRPWDNQEGLGSISDGKC